MYKYNFFYKYIMCTSHIHHASITHTCTPCVELENFWIYKIKFVTLLLFCRDKGWEGEEVQSGRKQTEFRESDLHATAQDFRFHFIGIPAPPPPL